MAVSLTIMEITGLMVLTDILERVGEWATWNHADRTDTSTEAVHH